MSTAYQGFNDIRSLSLGSRTLCLSYTNSSNGVIFTTTTSSMELLLLVSILHGLSLLVRSRLVVGVATKLLPIMAMAMVLLLWWQWLSGRGPERSGRALTRWMRRKSLQR